MNYDGYTKRAISNCRKEKCPMMSRDCNGNARLSFSEPFSVTYSFFSSQNDALDTDDIIGLPLQATYH